MIMAAKLSQPPISAPHVAPPSKPTNITKMMVMSQRAAISANKTNNSSRFGNGFGFGFGYKPSRVADQSSSGLVGDEEEEETELQKQQDYLLTTTAGIKTHLYEALQGINRGIFGVPSAKKSEIEDLVKLLESKNPTPEPTLFLDKVGGCWKLVYSTITILGSKRTKLGLRDFISLGNFFQTIDVVEGKAVNVIMFNIRGLNLFNGQLKIEASFKAASKSRVDIKYEQSTITPEQLMNVFRKNYELLLGIFNPEGWLEITYVDDTLRIGRDDKGNIFILERYHETKT